MDIATVLMLGASAVVGLVGAWLTSMAMEGAPVRVEADRDDQL